MSFFSFFTTETILSYSTTPRPGSDPSKFQSGKFQDNPVVFDPVLRFFRDRIPGIHRQMCSDLSFFFRKTNLEFHPKIIGIKFADYQNLFSAQKRLMSEIYPYSTHVFLVVKLNYSGNYSRLFLELFQIIPVKFTWKILNNPIFMVVKLNYTGNYSILTFTLQCLLLNFLINTNLDELLMYSLI